VLDLSKVAAQTDALVSQLRDGRAEYHMRVKKALDLMTRYGADFEKLEKRLNASGSKPAWLMAGFTEPFDKPATVSDPPLDQTVIATDGSHVDVDRHQSARCYLINIGQVRLDYGEHPNAELANHPRLYANKDEMVLSDGLREQAIEGVLLGIKRTVAEFDRLAELAGKVPPARPTLALADGSLIIWGLVNERFPDFVSREFLENGYLKAMDEFFRLAKHSSLTLASYTSFSRAADVANSLRLILCPIDIPDCDKHCKNVPDKKRPCEPVAGLQDSDIFGKLLKDGERSAVFYSRSRIIERYGPHRIHFFYLKLADEIARVEIPEWVASDKAKLDLTQALVFNQCQRGDGYPVALTEAHEQAVVTGADRTNFQQMLESWLVAEHLPQSTSAKSQSKRTRWI